MKIIRKSYLLLLICFMIIMCSLNFSKSKRVFKKNNKVKACCVDKETNTKYALSQKNCNDLPDFKKVSDTKKFNSKLNRKNRLIIRSLYSPRYYLPGRIISVRRGIYA